MNYKLDANIGNDITQVAKKAKEIAKEKDCIVEFDFNGILCLVNEKTVVEWLVRTYMDAHIMDWKTIGVDYKWHYDTDTEIELCSRRLERAKNRKIQEAEQKAQDDKEKSIADKLVEGIEISIIAGKEQEYADYVAKNSNDGYSRGVIDYGEMWAKLMQVEISKGKAVKDIADETQKPLGYLGISGFMYGCAVQALSYFWVHGEDLRKWHNKEYNHE